MDSAPVELKREFSLWSAFAFAFAFISPIVAMYGIYGLSLSTAGPGFWPIGKTVNVDVIRKGRKTTLRLTVRKLEDETASTRPARKTAAPVDKSPLGRLGLTLGPLDGAGRAKFGIAATAKGVLVTGVDPSGAAAEKYMRAGDVIAEVGGQPVASPGQIAQRLNADVKAGKKVVLFLVRRGEDLTYVGLRFD